MKAVSTAERIRSSSGASNAALAQFGAGASAPSAGSPSGAKRNRHVRVQLQDVAGEVQPGGAGHAQVGDHELELVRLFRKRPQRLRELRFARGPARPSRNRRRYFAAGFFS
jgi:hypothetical protein